jgi:hypothetical protein
MNVDRTPRNPNLLVWHGQTWLIDHGAALYLQHGDDFASTATRGFPMIADHVLLPYAGSITDADARLADTALTASSAAVDQVPLDWIGDPQPYVDWLTERLTAPRGFAEEAERAR